MPKQALWYVTSETYNGCQYILIIATHANWENFSAHTHKTEKSSLVHVYFNNEPSRKLYRAALPACIRTVFVLRLTMMETEVYLVWPYSYTSDHFRRQASLVHWIKHA